MSRTKPFIELLSAIVDNRGRTCPASEEGIPLIATNCINNDALYPAYEKVRYVSQETYDTWFRGHPKPGDLIFVTKGSPGRVCVAPDPVDFCIAQDMVAVRPDPQKVYPKYLFAALRSHQVQQAIGNMHVGTLIPHFKKGDFDKLDIPLPDSDVQEAIGEMYYSLSAKIELNRRMNETLEAMARAIFKSWFVDFDPVRAKASGEPPESICRRLGLTPDVLALFPDSFQDSELGEIPKGWPVRRVDDLLELSYGKALKAVDRQVGTVPVYGSGGRTGYHSEPLVDGPGIIVGRKGTVGSLYWENRPFFPIDTVFFVVPKMQLSYCYYVLQTLGLNKMNTDAAVPGLNRANVYRLCVVLPPNGLRMAFDGLRTSLCGLQFARTEEMGMLEHARDTLLPKLLSGEISVTDAERFIPRQAS